MVVDNLELKTVSSTHVDGATAEVDVEDPLAVAAAAVETAAEASTHTACLARCHLHNVVWISPGGSGTDVKTKCTFTKN